MTSRRIESAQQIPHMVVVPWYLQRLNCSGPVPEGCRGTKGSETTEIEPTGASARCPIPDKLPSPERPVRLPPPEHSPYDGGQIASSSGKRPCEKHAEVDALGVVVELPSIYGQPRTARKRLGQPSGIKKVQT